MDVARNSDTPIFGSRYYAQRHRILHGLMYVPVWMALAFIIVSAVELPLMIADGRELSITGLLNVARIVGVLLVIGVPLAWWANRLSWRYNNALHDYVTMHITQHMGWNVQPLRRRWWQ